MRTSTMKQWIICFAVALSMTLAGCADEVTDNLDPNQEITDPSNTDPNNTDPTTPDPTTPDPTTPASGTVSMNVQYTGTQSGNLVVGLFTTYPPQGPPVAFKQVDTVTFPANVSLADVPAGTYTGMVVLDVAPFNPSTQGPEDIMTVVTVVVPNDGMAIPVVLNDPQTNVPTPEPTTSDVTLNVVYEGSKAGNLVVGFFDAWPPQGPPQYVTQVPGASFPATAVLTDVVSGQYTALVMLDVEPFDPGNAGPEDLMTTVKINPPLAGAITVNLADSDSPVTDPGNNDPGNNDPGNNDPGNNDPGTVPQKDPNGANFEVIFEGDNADGNLVMAFFDSWPPMGPPKKVKEVQNVSFPAYAVVDNIASGDYTVVITLDRAPFNPSTPGPEDVTLNVDISVPTGADWYKVVLVDPFEDMEVTEVVYDAPNTLYASNSNVYNMGPLSVNTTVLMAGDSDIPVDAIIMTPEAANGDFPVVVFQHGFLMDAAFYSGILEHLSSHGFVIVAPQMYPAGGLPIGKPSTEDETALAVALYDWIKSDLENVVSVNIDTDAMGLSGHSRGGKVAWGALLQDLGLAVAIAGIDPVDGSEGPLATDSKLIQGPVPFSMPSLVVGTGLGPEKGFGGFSPACAPEGQNHVQFFSALPSPAWHVTVEGFGHNDMLNDEGCGFQCLACPSGGNKAVMRKTVAGLMTAFFRASLTGNDDDYMTLDDANGAPTQVTIDSK